MEFNVDFLPSRERKSPSPAPGGVPSGKSRSYLNKNTAKSERAPRCLFGGAASSSHLLPMSLQGLDDHLMGIRYNYPGEPLLAL